MILYKETSRLPKFISIVFIIQFLLFLMYYITQSKETSLLYLSIGILLISLLLLGLKLVIIINQSAINYSISGILNRSIEWSEIESYEIKKVDAFQDFMGWGIRYGKTHGWGFIFNTKDALKIKKRNGKTITLSVQDPTKIENLIANQIKS